MSKLFGPVVDVEFPLDKDLPDINNALHVTNNNGDTLVLEVTLELGDGVLRTISMESTDGLRRGMEVEDTGAPISVPVGKDTLGRVFNVLGDPIDGGPALGKDVKREGIHKEAPKYDELSTSEEIALLDKGPQSDKKLPAKSVFTISGSTTRHTGKKAISSNGIPPSKRKTIAKLC